jgi:uncharacterized protein YdaU (DUF1376 family)
MNKRMCKVCLRIKFKIAGNNYLFFDEKGKRWHGNKCPECFRDEAAFRNEKYRAKGTSKTVSKSKKRRCRACKGVLGADRYFKHASCDSTYQMESVWTLDDWGCGLVEGVRI